ncbi:SdpI family protein, partial [Singulisphaera rosea]
VGVRVPWTLASERVWNDTHRLAAWLFFGGGLFGAAASLAGYPLVGLVSLVPIVLIPIVYSAVRYKQLERRGEV